MPQTGKPLMELIQTDPNLASVIDRFGISFENYKLPLTEACKKSNVDSRFVMAIYNAFDCGSDYFPADELQQFPVRNLIEYLIKTHLYYLNNKLPKLEKLIDALITNYGNSELMLFKLKDFFVEYRKNLIHHIYSEERALFPYILKLINAAENVNNPHPLHTLLEDYSLAQFTTDHDHADNELHELGKRIRNYSEVNHHRAQVAMILDELKQFENDLALHGRLEDEVLLPRARQLEDAIKAKLQSLCVNN